MPRNRRPAASAAGIALLMLCAGSALGQSYTVKKLPTLGGGFSAAANDINDNGVIVGWSTKANDHNMHAVKWVNGAAINLDPLGWWRSGEAVGVNSGGFILTNQGTPTNCFPQGVQIFAPTSTTPLWRMDYRNMLSAGRAINASMHSVGCAGDASGVMVPLKWTSTMPTAIGPTAGMVTDALDLNDRGEAVGISSTIGDGFAEPTTRAVLIQGTQVINLPTPSGRIHGRARAINNAGVIIGDADNGTNICSWINTDAVPVRWNGGAAGLLPLPSGVSIASATDLNDRGEIVGLGLSDWIFGPILWRDGGTRVDVLANLISNFGGMSTIERITAINNKGQMVGWGYDAATFAITPVVITPCWGDFNGAGGITVQDVFDFVDAFFSAAPRADIDRSGSVSPDDLFAFLTSYFTGCP